MKLAGPVTFCACLGLLACAGEKSAPPRAPVQAATPPPATPAAPKSPTRGIVNIAPDIRKACGISDAEAHFAFDSANVRETDRTILGKLATCFVSGPLKAKSMRLVGHADPRGTEEYNLVLGGSRADAVKSVLVTRGMPGERVATTSRGEMEARGTDEASWADDRRVDVVLAQ